MIFRNINWIFCTTDEEKACSIAGGVIYKFIVYSDFTRNVINFEERGLYAFPPF